MLPYACGESTGMALRHRLESHEGDEARRRCGGGEHRGRVQVQVLPDRDQIVGGCVAGQGMDSVSAFWRGGIGYCVGGCAMP